MIRSPSHKVMARSRTLARFGRAPLSKHTRQWRSELAGNVARGTAMQTLLVAGAGQTVFIGYGPMHPGPREQGPAQRLLAVGRVAEVYGELPEHAFEGGVGKR